jgi:hypothetical protein
MTNSPARAPLLSGVTRGVSPLGGNLGQLQPDRLAHFLFLEQAHDLAAHLSNTNEAAVFSPAVSTGAAINRRRHGPTLPAESRPSPFPKVNHVGHSTLSKALVSRKHEANESEVARVAETIWNNRG